LLLVAQRVALECCLSDIPLAAYGSVTCSLAGWALGLVELCPLDYGLEEEMFIHDCQPDLPDLDLEVPCAYEPTVAAFVQQSAAKLAGLLHRQGAHPSAYTFRFPPAACWTGCWRNLAPNDRAGGRSFGAARHHRHDEDDHDDRRRHGRLPTPSREALSL